RGERLPYIDNTVNLLVAEDLGRIAMAEVRRVLAPNGVAYTSIGRTWMKNEKPRPAEIDEWTHFLHDASGNAVAHDTVVGPPRRMQWVGSPRWARHHDHMASLSALVSAGGRIFYIMDEGPKASIQLPPEWYLVARDAFNGTVLWKRPIRSWYPHLFPLKSGPALLPRRLVAVGDRVYVTLGINAPVSALDAATGKTIRTYPGTRTAEEIVADDGVLLLVVNPAAAPVEYAEESAHCWTERDRASRRWGWDEQQRQLVALDARTGTELWRQTRRVLPLSLAAHAGRVVFHDGERVVCLSQHSGEPRWRSELVARAPQIPTGYSPSLVAYEDVVLFSGKKGSLAALSAEDGTTLWTSGLPRSGHFCPEDIFVIDGLVWAGAVAGARNSGVFTGQDLRTGQVEKEFPPDVETFWMHQRCYPNKATDRYLIPGRTGTEFIDPQTGHWTIHHWVRGGCIYGVMPCNGLLYAPSHSCACYYQSKLNGFCALAPESTTEQVARDVPDEGRLERGPAYGEPLSAAASQDDWPTYRHDASRSGYTTASVPVDLKRAWQTGLGGRLSSPVIAGGTLVVASVDTHTVHALDATSGKALWSYMAGARVDSPPTIYRGRVLFGSADGWVYCLRASDGELAWRFRVAPADRRLVSYEQLESVWPVHGSVLVQGDVAYCLAGRSVFLDGGMRLVRLDPETGRKLSETILDDRDPETGENLQHLIKVKKMPVALPDILSSDGTYVYMRSQRFDLEGRRTVIAPEHERDQEGDGIHLFSPIGFLDDSWFHRAYWIYGKNAGEGWGEWFIPARNVPYGRILALDESTVYGYARDPQYLCNASVFEYRLFAADKTSDPERIKHVRGVKIPQQTVNWQPRSERPLSDLTAVDCRWLRPHPPLLVNSMLLARDGLFIAGPPDIADELAAFGHSLEPKTQAELKRQAAALEGARGALLWAVSATDGTTLAEYKLDAPPIFDGMAAANGRLYIATADGKVLCLAGG
ncbi:MAG: PQQ-binding-like beta-propeller repeat protein, partial [Candidatus Brocadiaceae bacterium]